MNAGRPGENILQVGGLIRRGWPFGRPGSWETLHRNTLRSRATVAADPETPEGLALGITIYLGVGLGRPANFKLATGAFREYPMGCPRESHRIPMGFPWATHGPAQTYHGRPMSQYSTLTAYPWGTNGDPWQTHGHTQGSPMDDQWACTTNSWETHGRPMDQLRIAAGDPWVTNTRPMRDPWATHRSSMQQRGTHGQPVSDS